MVFSNDLQENVDALKKIFKNNSDLVSKDFYISNLKASLIYFKGLSDAKQISEFILLPSSTVKHVPEKDVAEFVKNNVILISEVEESTNVLKTAQHISHGKTILMLENYNKAIVISIDKLKERAITEPPTSAVLKGPREGFNENIKTNIACVRKILTTPYLINYKLEIGVLTKTQVNVMYLDNVADQKVVDKIISKLKLINIDGIVDSYYVAQFLEERKKSMFKQVGFAEKPDVVCAKLLEGRIAVLVDGSPIVLTLPFVLIEDFQSGDDYYNQNYRTAFLRVLRMISALLTILLPGLYIATQLFHYRAVPLRFIVTILNSTQGLPFTPFSEIIVIIILFEILYEASLRMPKYLGLALSVVGALILGDTAVKAGLISPPAVMIVAVSGIAIYTIPEQAAQLSTLRLLFTIAGGVLGFYGLMLVSVFIVIYLSDFDNYGAPYLAPLSPKMPNDKQDTIFKADIVNKRTRPKTIPNKNSRRSR